jgi:LacI family transcriptional regulator
MSEVAAAAGVSMKSVSRVINREPNVTEKLRSKVQAAIDSLGYVPEHAARSLAGGRAFAIGLLLDNPSPHYTMKIQAGAYQACREHGFHLLIENLDATRADIAAQAQAILMNTRVDGFILTPPLTESAEVMDVLEARGIPYVRIAPVSFPGRSPSFAMDDAAAATELALHFWALGHRRFAVVNGRAEHGAARTRRAGFLEALTNLGLSDPVLEAYGGFDFQVGIEAGRDLLSASPRPTAIFAANDDSAAGVMSAAAQLGLRVPEDVSVAGFDDSWVAKSVWPYLTTVYQPISEMAHAAANLLIERAVTTRSNGDHLLGYHIVVRESTAPPDGAE